MKKRVLLTGITGFIGRHLARRMLEAGWEVVAIVRPSSDLKALSPAVRECVDFHVYEGGALTDIVREAEPTVVSHLASLYLAAHESADIPALVASNILFGTELLEAMAKNDVRRFVFAGTSWQHYQGMQYSPVNLYAATKEAFEAILRYYEETAGLYAVGLKLFDTYGEGDTRRKILALLEEAAKTGEELALSPGEQKLDLVHVDDVAEAFRLAAEYLAADRADICGEYAVSAGTALSLREIAARLEKLLGKKIPARWGARPYRSREVMEPWSTGRILPGWQRRHKEIM